MPNPISSMWFVCCVWSVPCPVMLTSLHNTWDYKTNWIYWLLASSHVRIPFSQMTICTSTLWKLCLDVKLTFSTGAQTCNSHWTSCRVDSEKTNHRGTGPTWSTPPRAFCICQYDHTWCPTNSMVGWLVIATQGHQWNVPQSVKQVNSS